MWSPIIRRQDLTTTPVGGTTQRPESTIQSQNSEGATTPRTSNSPSQAISSTEGTTPTSNRTTPTTTNAPTTTQQTSTSVPPTTTRSATSSTETSQLQTSTSSPNTSTSPASRSTTPSTSITATQTSDTQTSLSTSISSSPTDLSTSATSTAVIATSTSNSDTSLSPTPTPTPTPTPARTSSTTPDRESSTTSDAASSTLTSVLITTVATVNGQPTTLTTIVPTLASAPQGPSGLSTRSSKIVGGVVGGTLALLGVLLTLFYISRRRRKVAAIRDAPRLQAPRQMLDADDFDLAEPGPTPYAYGMVGGRANPNASGSIFHEALPGTSTQPSHSYSRSVVSENDPLLAHHMRGESADIDSAPTSSPRQSTHFRASSTTGLLYDPNDPFGDPPQSAGQSSRPHPLAVTKALEARPRGSEQHVYPPSAFRGPAYTSEPLSTSSSVLVHQDAGRIDVQDLSTPPAYGNAPR
ncbi:hypothetical protein RSOLAG22IIIB_01749 [Rhizoctonia solani]|uniref:Uncharacterized protein n=1 Tax=Rhizoctonia solani TaxID=456999 RepID=A0A0K6G915_9AGAM|nr:hypothetical protein RSOLAG22IIIB_01749 [Rhizoctonia solani]